MKISIHVIFAVIVLIILLILNTIFLHHCNESKKVQRETIRLEVFQELDSIAWVYEVHPNTKYVTGVKRYYKCDVIKKRIEQEIEQEI